MPMKRENKIIKHEFTDIEKADLNQQFRRAHKDVEVIESELDSVKSSYKAKITEAEAKAKTLDALLDAGFVNRDTECVVVYRPKDGEKDYYLITQVDFEKDGVNKGEKPAHTERMTNEDMQGELLAAEAKFELREDIILFTPTANDIGILVVGRLAGKWYAALRCKVGGREIKERLDSEQKGVKHRADQVTTSVKRFQAWLNTALGKDAALGFHAGLDVVIDQHREREE